MSDQRDLTEATHREPGTQPTGRDGVNPAVLVIAATVVGVVVILAAAAIAIAVDDGARAASMIALVIGPLATLLGFFALFVTVQNIKSDLGHVKTQTTAMTNGLGDAKMRAAVADVLPEHMIDPAMAEQLARDRKRRATAAEAAEALVALHVWPDPEAAPDLD